MKDEKLIKDKYIALNALLKTYSKKTHDYAPDKEAADLYLENHIKPNMKKFKSVKDRIEYLVKNNYYEKEVIDKYSMKEIEDITKYAYSFKHSFPSFMGILKFFNTYALKNFSGKKYLETYEERVIMNALLLGGGNIKRASAILKTIITGKFQPATPTFLNAGKKQRGEFVSCYLLRVEDNMESIARSITSSLQLSKRGGGVAICLTNLRETKSPIKKNDGLSSGIIPVMKLLEDSFSYANQLGQRQGAGAVYLNVHHPDILTFLDTKKENADEKIRIKSLSLGVVIPNITFELAKKNEDMALFSPYDIKRIYGKAMTDISITEEYENMLHNHEIRKSFISARKLFMKIAELHFESGYPYLMFDDTVNNNSAYKKRIVMSNLCSEIAQVSTKSTYENNLNYIKVGNDISCNLGSINIAKIMEDGKEFGEVIENSIRSLDYVSRNSDFSPVPSVQKGNDKTSAIGLGAMNLHGFLATNKIYYNSVEAVDFTNIFFYVFAYHAFKSSNKMAIENKKTFYKFEESKFATGEYFEKYTECEENFWTPATEKIKKIFKKYKIDIPTKQDWIKLSKSIQKNGLANGYLMAIAPTGSISYLSSCTPSLQPVVDAVEVRKEGKLGRVYYPAYNLSKETAKYYESDAYDIGPNPIIDIVSAAQKHIDQAISLTLFMKDTATTRDLNKAYIYAYKKKCKTIYYVRIRQDVIDGFESYEDDCEACTI